MCSGVLGDLGVAFPARNYHAEQMPGHSAFPLAVGFCIVRFLRVRYGACNKIRQQEKSLGAREWLVREAPFPNRLSRPRLAVCDSTHSFELTRFEVPDSSRLDYSKASTRLWTLGSGLWALGSWVLGPGSWLSTHTLGSRF